MTVNIGELLSFLETLHPQTVYRVPYISAELGKCGLEVTEMIKGNGIIVNDRRIEVIHPEWGENGIYPLHLLATIYEILTGGSPISDMQGRGFWYRDVLEKLNTFCNTEQDKL